MLKYFVTENNGVIEVKQMLHKKKVSLGSFKRSRHYRNTELLQLTNMFLCALKFIPNSWTNNDGTISEHLNYYNVKYSITIEDTI